jgi:hypothetical protein
MVILDINSESAKRATKRAIARPCKVKMIAPRLYSVTNDQGSSYRVRFGFTSIGEKFIASCDCAGGKAGLVCYHAMCAVPIHNYVSKN